MQINKIEVGKKINEIRKRNKYSMEEFGKQIGGAPKGTVNGWEKGVNMPNKERLELIALMGNTTVNELLYGSLEDYVSELLLNNMGMKFEKGFIDMIIFSMNMYGYSYGDDMKILQAVNKMISKPVTYIKQDTYIAYYPVIGTDSLYIGRIEGISNQQPIYYAFSDKEKNILHLMPFFMHEQASSYYQCPPSLTKQGEHTFLTTNFNTISLQLAQSAIYYYGIDRSTNTSKVSVYEYKNDLDCFILQETDILLSTLYTPFCKEIEKEVLYLQHSFDL